jgi:hypothetical protein
VSVVSLVAVSREVEVVVVLTTGQGLGAFHGLAERLGSDPAEDQMFGTRS